MGKQSERKNKKPEGSGDANGSPRKTGENSPKSYDSDTLAFLSMAQELKDEGNKLFQKRDQEGAILKYEKAIKLLPKNHIDVSYIRSNISACYMQMGISEYPKAIRECNLALEVTPKYTKALLKRARCYEGLNRLDLAFSDVSAVVNMEPHNVMALEIRERVKAALESRGLKVTDSTIELPSDYVEPAYAPTAKLVKDKSRKKKNNKAMAIKIDSLTEDGKADDELEKMATQDRTELKAGSEFEDDAKEKLDEKKDDEVKEVVEEKISTQRENLPMRTVKLFFGEDIRCVQLPVNCSLLQLRQLIQDRYPSSNAFLVKYRDTEGDLVSITSDEDLRLVEALSPSENSLRLYIVGIHSDHDPYFVKLNNEKGVHRSGINGVPNNGCHVKEKEIKVSSCVEDWIIHFAQLFKNHVGFESDRYLDIHEVGFELYNEALEETVTSEEAQDLFFTAEEKFQEMAALALYNCGNIHMSMARKSACFTDDCSEENKVAQIRSAYDWAQKEYMKAGEKYKEAVNIKADFYEGFLALGRQQFEQAKLSWYYGSNNNVDLKELPSTEVLELYNCAEDNLEKGMHFWEELEKQRLKMTSTLKDPESQLQKMGLNGFLKETSLDETSEQEAGMRSQINLLWGTILYERSVVEFRLELPVWNESLEVAVEKFALAGASPTDIAVMVKNHCSDNTSLQGFKIEELVQAWNEMYDARNWKRGIRSFRLEPLFRRRVSKIYQALEHA